MLFGQHQRGWLVRAASISAVSGLALLALTTSGVVWLVFDLALGAPGAGVALAVALAFFSSLWFGVPLTPRARHGDGKGQELSARRE